MASAGATPNKPRVRTVGFSLHGEAAEEPEVLESGAGAPSAPLPVIIPPAFQVRLHSERLALHALTHLARSSCPFPSWSTQQDVRARCCPACGHTRNTWGYVCARNKQASPHDTDGSLSAVPLPSQQPSPSRSSKAATVAPAARRPSSPASPRGDVAAPRPSAAASPACAPEAATPLRGPPAEPKPKLSKVERRELQEAQRAAKAELKGGTALATPQQQQSGKAPSGGPAGPAAAAAAGAAPRARTDAAPPSHEAASTGAPPGSRPAARPKNSLLPPRPATPKTIELFSHLPQFSAASLQDSLLSSATTTAAALHPAVLQLGCAYAAGAVTGSRARTLALLQTLRKVICDYSTPPEKTLARDLTARLNVAVQFLIDCRPLNVPMGNVIKSLKTAIAQVGVRQLAEPEARAVLLEHVERYIQERIELADKVIEGYACSKIEDGDVILTHAASATVLGALLAAHSAGKRFRVVVVDSRPRLEGRGTLTALLRAGVSCVYAHSHALSYVMADVTKVFLGAAAVLGNGAVLSRVGAAAVAMVAKAHGAPVLVLAQTCKLHERTQLDSITNNELGDPGEVVAVSGRPEICFLNGYEEGAPRLRVLNLLYDCTPAEYVTMIVTEVGMLPPTSVPVVLREYRKEVL